MPDRLSTAILKLHNHATKIAEQASSLHDIVSNMEEEIEALREKLADNKASNVNPNRPKRKPRETVGDNDSD